MRRLRPGCLRQTQQVRWPRSLAWAYLLATMLASVTVPIIAAAQAPPDEPPAAAAPRPALASLVPDDAGLCIEADRLAERAARFVDGPLGARLAHFPPVARWVGENGAQLGLAKAEFQRRLGASPAEIGSGIFGGRMLFAVWPPASGAANGPALLLVEAPDRALLERVLVNVVAVQREAGKWKKTWTLEHAGSSCQVHLLAGEDGDQWFVTSIENLAVAANDEARLREVIALSAGHAEARPALGSHAGYAAGIGRLSRQAALRVFINPRPWDAGLEADLKRKPPESHDARFQKAMIETWQATDYVVAGLEIGSAASLECFASWRTSALPPAVREAAESVGGRAALVERMPRSALAAVAGRIDWGRLVWRFGLPKLTASKTGAEVPPEWLLPASLAHGIGPDFGVYLAPRPEAGGKYESPLPVDLVAILPTRPLEPGDGRPALAKLAEPVLHSLLNSAAAAANAQSAPGAVSLEAVELRGVAMTSVSGWPGPRGRPMAATYAVLGDDFWLASSPAALARAAKLTAEDSLANASLFERVQAPSHLLYLDLQGARRLLASSPGVVEFLAARKGLDRDAAQRSFRELLALAELADTVSAAARLDETGVAAGIRILAQAPPPADAAGAE